MPPICSIASATISVSASGSVTSHAIHSAALAARLRGGAHLVLTARDEQHARALGREPLRRRPADAARGAGDDAHLVLQPEVHAAHCGGAERAATVPA